MRSRIPGRRRPWAPLLTAVMKLAGGRAEVLRHTERPWSSATFQGTRHTIALSFTGREAIETGEVLLNALPENEFAIPGQLVADAAVIGVTHETTPEARLTVEVELLLLEEA